MLKKTIEKHHRKVHRWCPPIDEFLKVNIDGDFLMDRNLVNGSFIVGDADGHVVMARASRLQSVHDSFLCRDSYLPCDADNHLISRYHGNSVRNQLF
jgi:hypothetical protein